MVKIFLGADHRGFEIKERLKRELREKGYEVEDRGDNVLEPNDDYTDYVAKVARSVAQDPEHARGVVAGYTGEGEAMMANRFRSVRAALAWNEISVKLSREHNDANMLSFGSRFTGPAEAARLTLLWLQTPFSGEERHVRRIRKLDTLSQ